MKLVLACALALSLLPAGAAAQRAGGDRFHIAVAAGHTDYDLAVLGQATVFSVRAGVHLGRVFGLEAHLGRFSIPEKNGNSAVYSPEAQLQVRWPGLRVSPYLGLGAGAIIADSYYPDVRTDTDVTFSTAVGLAVDLFDGVLVLGEVRARGVGTRFTGATGDLNLGVGYRF